METEIRRLGRALQFLTRLPLPDPGWESGGLLRASRYFGLVGALVGAGAAAVWLIAGLALPPEVAAGLALGAAIWLTGGLHEDGLADAADALGGHAPRERALEIMRDSRIGAYGVLALIVVLGLRWAALAALAPQAGALGLVLACVAGRGAIVPALAVMRPARAEGLGALMAGGPGRVDLVLALLPALALGAALGPPGLGALALSACAVAVMLWRVQRRLGGYTGDCLGAVAAVVETVVLVVLVGVLA